MSEIIRKGLVDSSGNEVRFEPPSPSASNLGGISKAQSDKLDGLPEVVWVTFTATSEFSLSSDAKFLDINYAEQNMLEIDSSSVVGIVYNLQQCDKSFSEIIQLLNNNVTVYAKFNADVVEYQDLFSGLEKSIFKIQEYADNGVAFESGYGGFYASLYIYYGIIDEEEAIKLYIINGNQYFKYINDIISSYGNAVNYDFSFDESTGALSITTHTTTTSE